MDAGPQAIGWVISGVLGYFLAPSTKNSAVVVQILQVLAVVLMSSAAGLLGQFIAGNGTDFEVYFWHLIPAALGALAGLISSRVTPDA